MNIGGTDTIIKNSWSIGIKKHAIASYLRSKWPDMVMEWPDMATVMETRQGENEIFFYENQEAKDSWSKYGCIDENAEKLVYLMAERDCITLVHRNLNIEEITRRFTAGD